MSLDKSSFVPVNTMMLQNGYPRDWHLPPVNLGSPFLLPIVATCDLARDLAGLKTNGSKDSPLPLGLRSAVASDDSLLRALFAVSRSDAERESFLAHPAGQSLLAQQFEAHRRASAQRFPQAHHDIVIASDGQEIGHLIVSRETDVMNLVEISLLPNARGEGIGTLLVRLLQREASTGRLPIRARVAIGSAARRFYDRLEFRTIGFVDGEEEMEWSPTLPVGVGWA